MKKIIVFCIFSICSFIVIGQNNIDTIMCPNGKNYLIPNTAISLVWDKYSTFDVLTATKINNNDQFLLGFFCYNHRMKFKNSSKRKIVGVAAALEPLDYHGLQAYLGIADKDTNIIAKAPLPTDKVETNGIFTELFFDDTVTVNDDFFTVIINPTVEEIMGSKTLWETLSETVNNICRIAYDTFATNEHSAHYFQYTTYDDEVWELWQNHEVELNKYLFYLFPILADGDDEGEEGNPEDSSSINSPELSMYTVVYPNPTSEEINIQSSFKITDIELTNTLGQIIDTYHIDNYHATLDVRHYPKGTYFVKITTKTKSVTKKIVVQ